MQNPPSPSRLESFSDGVIAVIITIMVLDLKIPKADGMEGFLTILPTLGVYVTSFFFTAIYWVNHHHAISRLKRVDSPILWSNLLFLMTLSLLPFFTNYMAVKGVSSFSAELYAASLLADGLTFTLLGQAILRHVRRHSGLYEEYTSRGQAMEMAKGLVSLAAYASGILLARFSPPLSLVLVSLVNCVWIVPDFGLKDGRAERPLGPGYERHDS